MFTTKPLSSFIGQPDDILRECSTGPVELTGGDQSYILMTQEYLRRLLTDIHLADHLDDILTRLRKNRGVPEEKVMEILSSQ